MMKKPSTFRLLLAYGSALGGLWSLMAWSKYRLMVINHATEFYILLIAFVFVSVGIWAGLRWSAPVIIEKTALIDLPVQVDHQPPAQELLNTYGISNRELEVLLQLAKGLSNDEIAENLFVSTNTVKTHLANLYTKLEVKRRAQAVEKARTVGLIG